MSVTFTRPVSMHLQMTNVSVSDDGFVCERIGNIMGKDV